MKKIIVLSVSFIVLTLQLISKSVDSGKPRKVLTEKKVSQSRSFNYNFSVLTGTYSNLTGATSLNDNTVWDDPEFSISLPFPFIFNGNNNANIIYFSGMGGELATGTEDDFADFILPLACDLIDRGYDLGISLSSIGYLVEGTEGNRILKIEWKNVGSYDEGAPYNMYINFQMWLYEGTNIVEYHYGPSMINDPDLFYYYPGAFIGITSYNESLDSAFNIHMLTGPAASPTLSTAFETVIGTPPPGTIFRFSPVDLSVQEDNFCNNEFFIYPNPAIEIITLKFSEKKDRLIEISDLTGKVIRKLAVSDELTMIDISDLKPGIYFISMLTDYSWSAQKFLKQ